MDWFEKSFGERYLQLYAHRNREEAKVALDFLFPAHSLAGRRVLDLACGPGRYLRTLYERGAKVVGLDLSAPLLHEAQRVFESLDSTAPVVRGDMRCLPFTNRRFDLTMSMFTSFGYFDTLAEHAALAAEMARVTAAVVVLDLPDRINLAATLVARSERRLGELKVVESRLYEGAPARVVKTIKIVDETRDVVVEEFEERVMLFDLEQITEWFGAAGFVVKQVLGSYDGSPYQAGVSPRMLLRLRRDRVQ